ncbi:hypothetical protein ANCCEY_09810 [Ancylostoma ceylanicum]|uniref:Phlebovirus glycoprotein G2 fusion domain-containing protein n=2 Tax=Ancylostoma ceylanicum TaxID=53326 RepID=A0A0D6LM23_9BILA|nr:hypothetical protein ANCCEY_09810 [Ancylostoma ceylanicum]
MIPRTGESYESAVKQLKSQYQDPKRMTITLIRQLQSMQQARDDPRSLRNNLNDIQAIITALQKQGETIEEMILRCNKDTLYFTRSTEVKVQYSKRCPHVGTCTGLKCAKTTPDTKVEELTIANNYTELTHCSESCGGLGCSCGFPSSGCLFYRIYHVPTDNNIYEIFECPTWRESIKLAITYFNNMHNPSTYRIELRPQVRKRLENSIIELTNFHINTPSLLHKRFLSNNLTTSFLDEDTTFSYACTSNPLLSKDNNSDSCTIRDTCKCDPAEDYINCYCQQNQVSRIQRLRNTLPLQLPNTIVNTEGKAMIPTIRTKAVSAELSVSFDTSISQLMQSVVDFQCSIIPMNIIGCYKCFKGALAEITCYSTLPKAVAEVSCTSQAFPLQCSQKGTRNQMSSSESDSFDLNLDLINIAMRIDRMYSLLKTIQRDLEKIKQATIPNPPAATPHEEEKEKPSTSRQ